MKITYFLATLMFKKKSTSTDILKLVTKYVELEAPFYECKTIVKSRDIQGSTALLSNLVRSYAISKSNVALDQILDVLKEEFLKRENKNARK